MSETPASAAVAAPSPSASQTAAALNGIAPLAHLGVIRAAGADAATFLQGQLTQDVVQLPVGESRLAALCSPKGRMLASFWVYKRAVDELLLVTSADTLPASVKRLSMFVMRAKAKLSDATADFKLYGLIGNAIENEAASACPDCATDQNDAENGIPTPRIALPAADGAARALWLMPADAQAPGGAAISEADWLWAEVRAGVARITQPVVEAFVPQMLNYESVDGVNFKKGCYPGQEVVARSQFRGVIKRRAYVGSVDGAALAGQDVFSAGDQGQPIGVIAQAAAAPDGGHAVIAALRIDDAAGPAELRVGDPQGARLQALAIPYPLRDDL